MKYDSKEKLNYKNIDSVLNLILQFYQHSETFDFCFFMNANRGPRAKLGSIRVFFMARNNL
jgi:hypothetical protein